MRKPLLLLCGLCLALWCRSQSGLHITGATTLAIQANTTIAIDGLVLTPSSQYVISTSNSLARSSTLLHPSITPAINRSFQWNATLPAFTGSIGFYYEEAELNGLSEAELTLNIHNGTHWQAYPGGVNRNTVTNLVTTPVSDLSINELALAAQAQPLPLEWGAITATRSNETALIEWHTYQEIQTAFFEVERSLDGLHWSRTGNPVPARNSPGTHHYQFIDASVSGSKTFYRIKQVDRDGAFSYSSIAWVPALSHQRAVSLFPNPATGQVSIQSLHSTLTALRLFDATGKQIRTEILSPTTLYTLAIASLPKAVYTVQVQLADGTTTHLRFIRN